MKKIFTLLFAIVANGGIIYAQDEGRIKIGDLYFSVSPVEECAYVVADQSYSADNYAGLTDVEIPDSIDYEGKRFPVTTIAGYAFYLCSGLNSIVIPNSVTTIGEAAFKDCENLTDVTMSDNLTSINRNSFENCNSLPVVNNLRYAGSYLIEAVDQTKYGYTIEEGTKIIGVYAFAQCNKMKSLTLPNSVTTILDYAFNNSGIQSISLSSNIKYLAQYAFVFCGGLKSFTVDEDNPYFTAVNNVLYNKDVTTLLKYPIVRSGACVIPNTVTHIAPYACYNNSISSILFPESVTHIGSGAFSSCISLLTVVFPDNLIEIGEGAFGSCNSIRNITISESVQTIGNGAFNNCQLLNTITVLSCEPPQISASTFKNIDKDAVVKVNFGCGDNYRQASYWQNLKIQTDMEISQTSAPTSCALQFTTTENIASVSIVGGEMFLGNTIEYIGLEPESEYTDIPVVLTSYAGETETIHVSFTTSALTLNTQESKPVSDNTAILLAETNMADIETNCGFEWKRNDAPEDMKGTKVYAPVANGTMAGRLKGLKEDVYYKYRAFYESAAGNTYYGDWKYIFTGDVAVDFDPVMYTYPAIGITESEAILKGYALAGANDFEEQGFEYWAESRVPHADYAPRKAKAALGEHHKVPASGISMKVTLTDLDAGTVYKYCTYAKSGDKVVYGAVMSFTTLGEYVEPTAIESIQPSEVRSQKVLQDGQLLILRGDRIYTVTGQEVR